MELDLDNTVLNIDSDLEWTIFYNKINSSYLFYLKIIYFFNKYNQNKLNTHKYNYFIFNKKNFYKICVNIYNSIFFYNIIKNKINNQLLWKINKIKKLINLNINTSTNKNISKILNHYIFIKNSFQSNNNKKKLKINIKINNYLKGLSNYKINKIKNFYYFYNKNFKITFYTDSNNDIIWIKKNLISNNPDKILFNNSISKKKFLLFKKLNKLFF